MVKRKRDDGPEKARELQVEPGVPTALYSPTTLAIFERLGDRMIGNAVAVNTAKALMLTILKSLLPQRARKAVPA